MAELMKLPVSKEELSYIIKYVTPERRVEVLLAEADKISKGRTEMTIQATFINKTQMKKVNKALEEAGFSGYPGDRTTTHPNGSGSGYVSNLVEYIGGQDHAAKNKVLAIVSRVLQ